MVLLSLASKASLIRALARIRRVGVRQMIVVELRSRKRQRDRERGWLSLARQQPRFGMLGGSRQVMCVLLEARTQTLATKRKELSTVFSISPALYSR